MESRPLAFRDEGRDATRALLERLPALRERALACSPDLEARLDRTRRGLDTLLTLDRQAGGHRRLSLEGTEELVAALHADLAHVEAGAVRAGDAGLATENAEFVLGVALWAIRHEVPLAAPEPVVNALAVLANAARSKPELSALVGLMQGVAAHVAPRLAADLERSNPERPWRVLHANLAIAAIRTEDPALMDFAFDALDGALPDERAGFYAEALALALAPRSCPNAEKFEEAIEIIAEFAFSRPPPPGPLESRPLAFRDEGRDATRALLDRLPAFRERALACSPALEGRLDRTRRGLDTLLALDRQAGGHGRLSLEGTEELVAALLTDLAHVEADAVRAGDAALAAENAEFVLGVALWAIRHEVPLATPEPVVNALAIRANAARSKPELSALVGLMQGVAAHVAPRLAADLERSNPERPWRVLHANLAIAAIRTEDPALIDFAFDALDGALPDERAGFYAEALALALAPGIAPAVRERIEARHLKWTAAR